MEDHINNLKTICGLLGIDIAENGLKDCELANDYLKRIIKLLGGA